MLIILGPIVYNKEWGLVTGIVMQQIMKMPKEVVVDNPTIVDTFVQAEATGRVEAKYSIDIVARVSGFLKKKFFNEGDYVKKDQLLFRIDPQEYELEVKNSQARNLFSAVSSASGRSLRRCSSSRARDSAGSRR